MYMPTLPAANASLTVPHSNWVFLPIDWSLHRMSCSISQARAGGVVVDHRLGAVVGLHPPAERVGQRGQHPAAGVVGAHLHVPGLAGRVGDLLGVLPHLVPRCRRGVGVEPGLLEQRPVVVQAHAVDVGRQPVDLAVRALRGLEHARVELGGVRQRLDVLGHVGDLLALGESLGVGERHAEGRRQLVAGELGGERLGRPLPLDRLHDDVGVVVHERLGLLLDRVDGALLVTGPPALDGDGDLAVVAALVVPVAATRGQRGEGDEGGDGRQRGQAASSVVPHGLLLASRVGRVCTRCWRPGLSRAGARPWCPRAADLPPAARWRGGSRGGPAARRAAGRGW